jgi:hypothetical protein
MKTILKTAAMALLATTIMAGVRIESVGVTAEDIPTYEGDPLFTVWTGTNSYTTAVGVSNIVSMATNSIVASQVSYTPTASIAATDVQGAIDEVAAEGWLLYDYGSNVWLRVSVSNYSFTVSEVAE